MTAIKPYGVFVSMNGVAGLLHISQVSSDRVYSLEKVLPVGMRLKCMVVSQDASKGRLALSTKTLEAKPGEMIKDPDSVFANAEATAVIYLVRAHPERARSTSSDASAPTSRSTAPPNRALTSRLPLPPARPRSTRGVCLCVLRRSVPRPSARSARTPRRM